MFAHLETTSWEAVYDTRIKRFCVDEELLVLRIGTPRYLELKSFRTWITLALEKMELREDLRILDEVPYHLNNGDVVRMDDSCDPHAGLGRGAWPTLVLEMGHTNSLAQLREDAARWFPISRHQVQMALLIEPDESAPWPGKLVLELYRANQPDRQPRCTQRIKIQPFLDCEHLKDPCLYEVRGGELRLDVDALLLREPIAENEDDIVIEVEELQMFSKHVFHSWLSSPYE